MKVSGIGRVRLAFSLIIFSIIVGACGTPPPQHCDKIPQQIENSLPHLRLEGRCGGPYKYDGGPSKTSNFGLYFIYDLDYSYAKLLTREIFFDSIQWYCRSTDGFPYGDLHQRFNYVINDKNQIWIATWRVEFSPSELHRQDICVNKNSGEFKARFPSDILINFFPEETKLNGPTGRSDALTDDPASSGLSLPKLSPCYLLVPPSARTEQEFPGFLDAMSKHFFISQFAYDREYRGIPNYHPKEWTDTEVEYAGEIVVDVQRCEYEINSDSGTYKPDRSGLPRAGVLFAKLLDVRPARLRTFDGTEVESLDIEELNEYPKTFC